MYWDFLKNLKISILRCKMSRAIMVVWPKKVYWTWVLTWILTFFIGWVDRVSHRVAVVSLSWGFDQNHHFWALLEHSFKLVRRGWKKLRHSINTGNEKCNLSYGYLVEVITFLTSEAYLEWHFAIFDFCSRRCPPLLNAIFGMQHSDFGRF